jgi:glycosyltransferase involved in cell wall biosynthesis
MQAGAAPTDVVLPARPAAGPAAGGRRDSPAAHAPVARDRHGPAGGQPPVASGRRAGSGRARSQRPRILITTEGTYPYVVGGVSSWCDLVIGALHEFDWQVLPVVAGERGRSPSFKLPAHASLVGHVELWCQQQPKRRWTRARARPARGSLPAELVRALLGWEGSHEALLDALLWCRRKPDALRRTFRGARAWSAYLEALEEILDERHPETTPPERLDAVEAALVYQTIYWVARAAGVPTPATDLLHVTAAGWAAIPALVHKEVFGTPMLLTEHGVYVREAYLAAARSSSAHGHRFLATRLARGLSLAAYRAADCVAPVAEANATWERELGVQSERIRVIQNGIDVPSGHTAPPGRLKVVSVGRIDPLKDVQTMLRVAAEVGRRVPGARFEYWGPPSTGQETYAHACEELSRRLGADAHFRFMGPTGDPHGVLRDADVVLMTSISEALPMSILEAMAQGRPVVATSVGGVPEVLHGCGIVVAPGDVQAIAAAVSALLRNPSAAARLGRRGFARAQRLYTRTACVSRYRSLLCELTGASVGV